LSDVALSNNYSKKGIAKVSFMTGEEVQIKENKTYFNIMKEGYQISCLSKDMGNKIRQHQNNGYILQKAEIENIVIWNEKESGEALKEVLCYFMYNKIIYTFKPFLPSARLK
jgi:hypothetical protein